MPLSVRAHAPRLLCLQHSSIFESYGGVEYYLDDLLKLSSELFGGEQIATLVPQRRELFAVPDRPYRVTPVPFSRKSWRQKIDNRLSATYLRVALESIKRFQPTLLLNAHVSLGPLVYALHKITRVPYVTVVYGIEAWGHLWPQDEWCLKQACGILSISHWTKNILLQRGYDGARIQIAHPAIPREFENLPIGNRRPRTQGAFQLLSVSRLDANEQYKGQDHALQALKKLQREAPELKWHYRIQGDGTDKKRLQDMVQTLGLSDQVEFVPQVKNREALSRLYQEADLFVMPSRFGRWGNRWRGEGFGIVFAEAAAHGVPSLAYRCGGVMDIIREGEDGWLATPDSMEDLTVRLKSILRDPDRLVEMGKRAHESVNRQFCHEAILREVKHAIAGFTHNQASTS